MIAAILPIPIALTNRDILFWSDWLMLAQASYLVILALKVRQQRYDQISNLRLVYGGVSLFSTGVACLFPHFHGALVVSTVVAFSAVPLFTAWNERSTFMDWAPHCREVKFTEVKAYLITYGDAAIAGLISGVAFHIASIFLTGLGTLSSAWAIVLRISGGFSTVAIQLIAPVFEVDFSRSIREGDCDSSRKSQKSAIISGTALATLVVSLVICALWYTHAFNHLSPSTQGLLLLCSVLYVFSILTTATFSRNLVLAGGRTQYLLWTIAKVSASLIALFKLSGGRLLLGLVTVEAIFQVIYVVLAFLRVRIGNDLQTEGVPQSA
jgi:hypothetical protein